MKTLKTKQTIRSVLVTLTLALSFFGCAKKSSDGTTAAATTYNYNVSGQCVSAATGQIVATTYCTNTAVTGYQLQANGLCYQTSTGQQVAQTYCTNTAVNGYQLQANGLCYQTSTGQQVPQTYCTQTGNVGTAQICSGYFQDPRTGQTGICYGANSNCSTLQMINIQTGQTVLCQ